MTPFRFFLRAPSHFSVAAALCVLSSAAVLAQIPLTPILGVSPTSLDFGTVPVDSIMDLQITLSNDAGDPRSMLVIDSLAVDGYGFILPNPPTLPLSIPGDGTTVDLTIRFEPPWPIIPSATLGVTAVNAINQHTSVLLAGEGSLEFGVPPGAIMGYDEEGIPFVCGTGLFENLDPPDSRGWECIPSVIRDNGTDTFAIEVDVTGPVTDVRMSNIEETRFVPPASLLLRDDGLGGDRIANDFIFTSGAFRYNVMAPPIGFYGPVANPDPNSPDGLVFKVVGRVLITELDMTVTEFLERPQAGCLRSNVPLATVTSISPTIATSSHLINIQTSGRETQRGLRGLGGDPSLLTVAVYEHFQDAADLFVFLSTDKVEVLPRLSEPNGVAGNHLPVRTGYAGTGLDPDFDNSAAYGSQGRLLGFVRLDTGYRGLITQNATHELEHQWGAYTSPLLGLQTGSHYLPRSSVGSLIGGFRWIDNGNGTFTLDCTQGRGGAHHASLLDKYLMGLIPVSSVVPMHIDNELAIPCVNGTVITQAEIDRTTTIADIQAIHGVRFPGPLTAQRGFTLAFVAESHDRLLNQTEMTFYEVLAEHYAKILAPEVPDPYVATSNWVPITRFFSEGTTWRTDFPILPPISVFPDQAISAEASSLELAAPNPLSVATEISYTLSTRAVARLEIYDVGGRLVRHFVRAPEGPGLCTQSWDARDNRGNRVPSGVYYYRLHVGGWQGTHRLIVLK